MTLYERIMAYRKLKMETGDDGETTDPNKNSETEKPGIKPQPMRERSDTGFGSVDISHYTNKKDDDDNRSPTPAPTLTDNSRRKKYREDAEIHTARDVIIDVDENKNRKEPLPPVRSTTPQQIKRSQSPQTSKHDLPNERSLSRHSVLPPIGNDVRDERTTTMVTKTYTEERDFRKDQQQRHIQEEQTLTSRQDITINRNGNESNEGYRSSGTEEDRRDRRENRKFDDVSGEENHREGKVTRVASEGKVTRAAKGGVYRVDRGEIYREDDEKKQDRTNNKSSKNEHFQEQITPKTESNGNRRREQAMDFDDGDNNNHKASAHKRAHSIEEETTSQNHFSKVTSRRDNSNTVSYNNNHTEMNGLPKRETSDKGGEIKIKEEDIKRLDAIVDNDLNNILLGKRSDERSENALKSKIFDPKFQDEINSFLNDI